MSLSPQGLTDDSDRFHRDLNIVKAFANQTGFVIEDVARDGNCLFAAMEYGLSELGIQYTHSQLRSQLCTFFQSNPYTSDGSEHLKRFHSTLIANPDSYFADTEQPTEEDYLIEAVRDPEVRSELRWQRYLTKLRSTGWGDHVAVQGLANMLSVNMNIISSHNTITQNPCNQPSLGDVNIGLIGQFHYVALKKVQQQKLELDNALLKTASDGQLSLPSVGRQHNERSQEEQSDTELCDGEYEQAFNDQIQLRGLPNESGMQREDSQLNIDDVYSVAPAYGQKPIAILTDEHFEEMCNPARYPLGTDGLNHAREKLTIRKYFNQRLLDADGRFAKDIEYLLTAQYAVESKQVNEANIALRQTQGRLYRGQSLTGGSVKSPQLIKQMIRKDDAYRFLKNVRGSPAYFQRVVYDVLAIIRQLGLPTWFLTLSAADMQWPDVIQTIARQYGTILTDEDVKTMSFEDRSKWLRQNPVTAARHFQDMQQDQQH